MDFNEFNLDSRLNAGIRHAGFHQPTPIQEQAIPLALAGHDLIGTAQTGTGKTAAFVLPILNKLLQDPGKGTRALIITPTRELAEQIHQTIGSLRSGTNIRSIAIYGGVGPASQIQALRQGVEILVACPGRLLDHIQNKHANLGELDVLVIDEADRMFDMGFLPDIKRILQHVPKRRQTMLFSATFPKEIEQLASQILHAPKRVALGLARPVHTVAHTLYPVPHHLKKGLLIKLLKQTDTNSVLIFTRTKHRAQRLTKQIKQSGYKVTSLHSNRTQGQRQSALNGFKQGRYQIMVATDIAARGLDIESISHVINYDMPDTADAYIHRIGRTGRAKRTGEAFTMITPEDLGLVRKIEKIMNQKLTRETLPDFDYEVPKQVYSQTVRIPKAHANRTSSDNRRSPNNKKTTSNRRPSNNGNSDNNQRPSGSARPSHKRKPNPKPQASGTSFDNRRSPNNQRTTSNRRPSNKGNSSGSGNTPKSQRSSGSGRSFDNQRSPSNRRPSNNGNWSGNGRSSDNQRSSGSGSSSDNQRSPSNRRPSNKGNSSGSGYSPKNQRSFGSGSSSDNQRSASNRRPSNKGNSSGSGYSSKNQRSFGSGTSSDNQRSSSNRRPSNKGNSASSWNTPHKRKPKPKPQANGTSSDNRRSPNNQKTTSNRGPSNIANSDTQAKSPGGVRPPRKRKPHINARPPRKRNSRAQRKQRTRQR